MFNSLLYIFSNSRVIKKKLSSLFVLASCLLLTSCADINGAAEMVSFTVIAVIMLPFTIILAPVFLLKIYFIRAPRLPNQPMRIIFKSQQVLIKSISKV